MQQKDIDALYSTFIAKRTYARWLDEERRRETWSDSVNRYYNFVAEKVPDALVEDFEKARQLTLSFGVMPSMRGLWSAGPALSENNIAMFNCAFMTMDEISKFGEMLYILMHGTGMGFSVERQFVVKLPEVPEEFVRVENVHVVEDSKLGWKLAYDHCINSLFAGELPAFDYSLVRPKGARLRTFGGRASGPDPLKQLMEYTIRMVKGAAGRKLNSLEVHDICCMIANCVVVGGVRRSACISFSNLSDQRMKHAKDGAFWNENPQRSMSNNSIAYTEKPDNGMFMEEWLNLMRSGSGERGIFNVVAARRKVDKMGRQAGDVRSNPCCFTGDMQLLTTSGYVAFSELAGKPVSIIALDGTVSEGSVWSTGTKPIVRVNTTCGVNSITCTPDHVFMIADGMECQAKDLKGKRLAIPVKIKDSFDRIPFMAGFIQGDGTTGRLNSDDHKGLEINIGINDLDVAKLLNAEVRNKKWYSTEARCVAENFNLDSNPLPTRDFPKRAWRNNDELCEFLSGLWSANGCVISKYRVAFKTTNKNLALELKRILMETLNIASYITTNKPSKVAFANGTYICKESYDLNIGKLRDIVKFAEHISFVQEYKRVSLRELIKLKSPLVTSVVEFGEAEVYDFNEPKWNWGIVEGVIVHNCEALLRDREMCNLTEVVVRATDKEADLRSKIRAAVLIGCLQAAYNDFKHVSPQWKENSVTDPLLGVSMTGTCDNPLLRKVNENTQDLLRDLKKYAHQCAAEFAKELGMTTPKQITLNKPSGTVSQLVNCASGIHPRYADYYIRRVRVNAKDPISRLLIDKGVPWNPEVGQTVEEHNTVVFEFPMKSPRGAVNRHMWTALEQLEYWKMFNECWCDGNPSQTIYVKEDEWVEVGAWIYKNWNQVCGLSFLPHDGGTYQLAPYEELTAEEYHTTVKAFSKVKLDLDTELNNYEQDDNTEGSKTYACTGTSCEL